MNEMDKVREIQKSLVSLKCPHIDQNEDEEQIKSLLLEDSCHKTALVQWLLELLTNGSSLSGLNEAQQSLGLDLKSIQSWSLALELAVGKFKLAQSDAAAFASAKDYLDLVWANDLAIPVDNAQSKSSLIPRDIEKDVWSRGKKDAECDIVAMTTQDFQVIKDSLVSEIQTRRSGIKPEPQVQPRDFDSENLIGNMKQYQVDFEQDFKPWTDRVDRPKQNIALEKAIEKLSSNMREIHGRLELNSKLRQVCLNINEAL